MIGSLTFLLVWRLTQYPSYLQPMDDTLPYIDKLSVLQQRLSDLNLARENIKDDKRKKRGFHLSKQQREEILAKTDGHCHVCGGEVSMATFQADHMTAHSTGGSDLVDNFLPACAECNNYRWDYLPEELKWILKIGVFAREQIKLGTSAGLIIGEAFIKKEIVREERRKQKREPLV